MIWKEAVIALTSVLLEDETFKITTEEKIEDLAGSIGNDGLINLPVIIKKKSGYAIVSGYRRIKAIKSLGQKELAARVLHKNTAVLECVKLAVSDNSFQRTLNLIEYSRCYKMLSHYYKEKELSKTALLLGLPDNQNFIKKVIRLCDLPGSMQKYILLDTLSLPMALELSKPEYKQIGIAIADIFDQLKLSLNKQREFLTLCYEIAAREDIAIADLIKSDDFSDVLSDQNLDRNQKTHILRAYLKKRRFPSIKIFESEFEKNVSKLNLISGAKLIPPADFEGNSFTIKLEFNKISELNKQTSFLNKLIKNPVLEKIVSKG